MNGLKTAQPPGRWVPRLAPEMVPAVGLVTLAVAVRLVGFPTVTGDFRFYLEPWSRFIATHGGFSALRYPFADYNVPYLYVLVGLTWLTEHTPVTLLTAVKTVSVLFDGVLAYYAARLVSLRHPGWRVPLLAAVAVLFLPSVILDGSFWGQCDSIYAAFTLAGLYHLLRDRPWLGCLLLGTAYAIKQQTVFVLPVLLILLLGRRLPWRCVPALAVPYLLLAVPAGLAGRPWGELMTVYVAQTGRYRSLTMQAPTVFAFVTPGAAAHTLRLTGVLLAAAAFLALTYTVLIRRLTLDAQRVVILTAVCAMMAPMLLPAMHERYFYLADVLTVVAAFWMPRRLFLVPLLVQTASFLTYQSYVFDQPLTVDLRLLTLLMLTALLLTATEALRHRDLAPTGPEPVRPGRVTVPSPAPSPAPGATPAVVPAQRQTPDAGRGKRSRPRAAAGGRR